MKDFSTIYDLVCSAYLHAWREKIEAAEVYKNRVELLRNQLKEKLNEECSEFLRKYEFAIESMIFDKDVQLSNKILNIGMKIGFELGEIFSEIDYKNR